MLPTFVIGLREGVEAALIVGIVAAFLRKQPRADALRWMWAGVALAVALCAGVAVVLEAVNRDLPHRQQEGLETVVAAVAVAMVTFMIVWMRRHAGDLAGELRASAATALASGSIWALVGMAFFAVLREGFETAVFLLAAFQASTDPAAAGSGALLGVVVALGIGWGIYRGGVRINLGRFFRATAAVLVLVAAGLVSSAIHTAHEATWFNGLQGDALDLTWLVHPGSVVSSLLTGILGLQPETTVGETVGWLIYTLPMMAYVLWPERWRRRAGRPGRAAAITAGVLGMGLALAACGDDGGSTGSERSGDRTIAVKLTDEGCAPSQASITAGAVRFEITNAGTSKVSELELMKGDLILGERENIAPGLSADFTLDVKPGTYSVSCPGAAQDRHPFTVTGTATAGAGGADPLLAAAAKGWKQYTVAESRQLLAATKAFAAAVEAGDVQEAKDRFARTRFHYETIEPVAESFGDLDPAIDARENDVEDAAAWTGFHRIEKTLWREGSTSGLEPFARRLVRDVTRLDQRIPTLTHQPAQLANGAVELLNEVANGKITGEEDRYSHTDLSDFQGNLDGARKAFDLLRPALARRGDADLARTLTERFDAVQRLLSRYERPDEPSGWATYGTLTPADRRALAQAVNALAEPLSTVAGRITG